MSTTARKRVQKKKVSQAAGAKQAARDRVVTFRVSADEAALIAKAADRAPLARYSREAVLARAQQAAKAQK